MPLPKPKLLAGWRRAKLIALINELYLSFRGCGTCGVVVNALALSTNPQAGPLAFEFRMLRRRIEEKTSFPRRCLNLWNSENPHFPKPRQRPAGRRASNYSRRAIRIKLGKPPITRA